MALFHFHVTQIGRKAGQSAIASAAYRSGEKLHSEYYGEDSDYTKKRGVLYKEILLPPHAPTAYNDRETLWNEVEKAERQHNAQLAYSFDIALQNELTYEENLEVAKKFLQEHMVSKGMIVDFCLHNPERDGIENPHFHVMSPIRPLNEDGTWGAKQHRVYKLDDNGERLRDEKGKYIFDAVPTTDWGKPETLLYWREQWTNMVNAKFAEKGLDCIIDHRSYEERGLDIIPTVHEGVNVRAMEKKGIVTEKGQLNRWIRATNDLIKKLKQQLENIKNIIEDIKKDLEIQSTPNLIQLLNEYYAKRNIEASKFSKYARQKAHVTNLKYLVEITNFLQENEIYTVDDLKQKTRQLSDKKDDLQSAVKAQNKRINELKQLLHYTELYKANKPVYDKLCTIKFKMAKEKFKKEHDTELRQFYLARRKLNEICKDGKYTVKEWNVELINLQKDCKEKSTQINELWNKSKKFYQIQSMIENLLRKEHETNKNRDIEI